MQSYEEFVEDSIEKYESLPQETNELYKKHYVNIPFDLKKFELNKEKIADDSSIDDITREWTDKVGIKFDVLLGSHRFITKDNEFVEIKKASESESNNSYEIKEDKYLAYINARTEKYVAIDIPEGKSANINMLILNSNKPLNTRITIKIRKNAKLNLFEYYGSTADITTSLATVHEIDAEEGSYAEINALHNEGNETIGISFYKSKAKEKAHVRINSVYNGGQYTRARSIVEANETESRIEATEVVFGSSQQKFDIETRMVNAAPNTNANLESKAALMDSSFCILKGFAKIERGAKKSKSYVHERGILLDKGAKVDGLPDMSVDENDVKATHSSATAPVDSESVFYLMSRGIDEIGVRKLLVTGFFANCLSKFHSDIMKGLSMSLINSKLQDRVYGTVPKMDTRNMWIGISSDEDTDMFKGHYKYRKS